MARPWVLLGLPLVLGLAAWGYRCRGPTLIQALPEAWHPRLRGRATPPFPWFLRMGAVGVLVLALAGPQVRLPGPSREGLAIMLVLDISGSMESRDMGLRTRLEVAKEELRRFVEARPDDLLGLVTFSREAVTRVPPTTDHPFLLRALDGLGVDGDSDGTAVGTGVGLAVHRVVQISAPSRVLVLITDGRSNTGFADPLSVARAAGALQVRVHTIGVGGAYGEDPLDETLLREISRLTGGSYFRAQDHEAFRSVLAQLGAMETGPVSAAVGTAHRPLHGGLLWGGAFLLLLESLLWVTPGRRAL